MCQACNWIKPRRQGRLTSTGLTNPMGPLPTAKRSSLTRVRIEAKTGADADVPPLRPKLPLVTMAMLSPIADTSG